MTEEIDLNELIMGERKSLHDISNKLVVAQGMSSFVQIGSATRLNASR